MNRVNVRLLNLILVLGMIYTLVSPVWGQKGTVLVDATRNPPAKPTLSSLVISSRPQAKVYLNNELKGVTDKNGQFKSLTLKPGRYIVTLKLDEYEEFQREVSLKAGAVESFTAALKPVFGFILLSGLSDPATVKIILDEQILDSQGYSLENNGILRLKTKLGRHLLHLSQPNYQDFQKEIMVEADEPVAIEALMRRQPAVLLIKGPAHAHLYIDGVAQSKIPAEGLLKVNLDETRSYRLALELDGFERKSLDVSATCGRETAVDMSLTPLPTSASFNDLFIAGLGQWNAPQGWKIEKGFLHVQGPGIGLPKERRYRDCEISFGLRLVKKKGAAWILRAKDENNYYLFLLGGPEGRYPNQFRAYICRDGKINLDEPVDAQLSYPPLRADEDYQVRIRLEGNTIAHSLIPSESGEEISIGLLKDANNSFPYGNMGFTAVAEEDFLINGFVISLLGEKPTK